MDVRAVFDIATAGATITLPLITIWGWRYVSRHERRLALLTEARQDVLASLRHYMDYLIELRATLPDDEDTGDSGTQALDGRRSQAAMLALESLRDYDALFPEARPIREAIIQHHASLFGQVADAIRGEYPDNRDLDDFLAEVIDAVWLLRVAISNVVTQDLLIRTKRNSDPETRFGLVSVSLADYEGGTGVGFMARLRSWRRADRVWLLIADNHEDLDGMRWTYVTPTYWDRKIVSTRSGSGEVPRRVEIDEVRSRTRRSALYEGIGGDLGAIHDSAPREPYKSLSRAEIRRFVEEGDFVDFSELDQT